MNEIVLTIIIAAISGGLFGFLGIALGLYVNRNKNKADTKNTDAETKDTTVETMQKLETQVSALVDRNIRVETEREKERDAKRVEITQIKNELLTVQEVNAAFINKFDFFQRLIAEKDNRIKELEAQDTQKNIRINELESLVAQHSETIIRLSNELKIVKRQTGNLTK